MALRAHLLTPKIPTLQPPSLSSRRSPSVVTFLGNRTKTLIKCSDLSSGESDSESELASNLAREVAKMNTLLAQRAEAMAKSRGLLFKEVCQYLCMDSDEVGSHWRKMEEEDKWVLVKRFVSDWGVNFHPLSARSIKELIEEHLRAIEDEQSNSSKSSSSSPSPSSSSSSLFPSLKKLMWFSQD
ncbi:uncharacterized protein LOC133789015 [Humulus lupulus]|uniref:uncharacterized protein LOC133789015 n=1 Tax=Humulus lupulus TaxID=3486 RepID=UPI002B408703|nr:uncharacterized protein LOC133789015 [Humulus lupulus]